MDGRPGDIVGLTMPWKEGFISAPYGDHTFKRTNRFAEHKLGIALVFALTDTKGFHDHVFSSAQAIYLLRAA